ncbi:MAG TPA: hypothetical protein VFP01_08300 [Propionibacteriaceae bacterium]|nr:hypothetical protein [Propionibacteriaceae bacterium]
MSDHPSPGIVIIGQMDSGLEVIAEAGPFSSPSKASTDHPASSRQGTTMNPRYDFTGQVALVTGAAPAWAWPP